MTPPSLTVAREILVDAAAKARESGDPFFGHDAAAAIDVVLAELDRQPRAAPPPWVDREVDRVGISQAPGETDDHLKERVRRSLAAAPASVAPPRAGDTLLLIVRGDGIGPPSAGWSPVGVVQGFTLSSTTVTQSALDASCGAAPGIPSDIPIREIHFEGGDALELGRRAAAAAAEVLGPATTHGTAIPPGALVDDMLPCPFCRSTVLNVGAETDASRPRVVCGKCGARGPLARSDAGREAIANWNRRPAAAPHEQRAPFVMQRSAPAFGEPTADGRLVVNEHAAAMYPDHARTAPPAVPPIDAQTVRILGRGMGYGRLMQIAEEQWRDVAGDGSELTVGPCAGLLVPCICATSERIRGCDWCMGTRRVTERVRQAIREADPAAPWSPAVNDLVELVKPERVAAHFGQQGTIVRRQDSPRLPWVVRWHDGCETGYAEHEIRPATLSVTQVPTALTLRGRGIEVHTREQAIALFGRGSALADAPLPFVMVDGTPIAEPAPGAPRVLCGLPVDGCAGNCDLRYGHHHPCQTHCRECGAALPLSPGRPGCAECSGSAATAG